MYRIVWRTYYGTVGCGEYILTYDRAVEIVRELNSRYANDIYHWFEQEPKRTPKL